jgi:hypothetical protein
MDSILFILVLACLLLVAGWYVGNEMRGGNGEWGLLGIVSQLRSKLSKEGPSYRERRRPAPGARPARDAESGGEDEPAYTAPGAAPRFREKDERGYRARGPAPRFGERPAVRPERNDPPSGDDED